MSDVTRQRPLHSQSITTAPVGYTTTRGSYRLDASNYLQYVPT